MMERDRGGMAVVVYVHLLAAWELPRQQGGGGKRELTSLILSILGNERKLFGTRKREYVWQKVDSRWEGSEKAFAQRETRQRCVGKQVGRKAKWVLGLGEGKEVEEASGKVDFLAWPGGQPRLVGWARSIFGMVGGASCPPGSAGTLEGSRGSVAPWLKPDGHSPWLTRWLAVPSGPPPTSTPVSTGNRHDNISVA